MNKYTTQLVQLAKEKGLKIRVKTERNLCVSGVIFKDGCDYIIQVNRADKKTRQRYTIAILMSYFELNREGVDNSPVPIVLNNINGFAKQKSLTIKSTDMALDLLVPKSVFKECVKKHCVDGIIYDDTIAELADMFEVPLVLIEKRMRPAQTRSE